MATYHPQWSIIINFQHSLEGMTLKKESITLRFFRSSFWKWLDVHEVQRCSSSDKTPGEIDLWQLIKTPLEDTSAFLTFSSGDDIEEGKCHLIFFRSSFWNNWICVSCSSSDKTSGQIDLWQLINTPLEYTSAFSTFSSGDDKGKEKSSQIRFHLTFYLSSCN